MEIKDGKPVVKTKTRLQWRKWLKQNGQKEKSIWLIVYHKNKGTRFITSEQAVEEALCFGWIDSLAKKRDSESFYLTFTPRKPRSNWSEINIARAEKLISAGLMMPEGQCAIDLAIELGKWKK